MIIKKYNQFILEELRRIKSDSSGSGRTRWIDSIHDDPISAKSPSAGILLKDKLKKEEIKDMMDLAGNLLPESTVRYFINNPTKIKKFQKYLVMMNNLKFLKDTEKEVDELRCEYCNKGPLVIYDITTTKVTPEMMIKRNYRFSKKFNSRDGATCDHKNPQSKDGDKFDYSNLAVCCNRCNQKKGNMSYEDWMKIKNIYVNK